MSESQQEDTVASLLSPPSPIGLWIGLNAAVSLSGRRGYGNVGNNQQRSSRSSSITSHLCALTPPSVAPGSTFLLCLRSLCRSCLINHLWSRPLVDPPFTLTICFFSCSLWRKLWFESSGVEDSALILELLLSFLLLSRSSAQKTGKRPKDVETTRLVSPYHRLILLRWKTTGSWWGRVGRSAWMGKAGWSHRGAVSDDWMTALFSLASSFPSAAPGPETGSIFSLTTTNRQKSRT